MNLSVAKKIKRTLCRQQPMACSCVHGCTKKAISFDRENLENFWDIYCKETREGKVY